MVTRDEDTYTAKTKYNLRPVAYEVPYTQTESKASSVVPIFKGESLRGDNNFCGLPNENSQFLPPGLNSDFPLSCVCEYVGLGMLIFWCICM